MVDGYFMLSVSLLQGLTCCLFPYCKVSHVVCFPTARSHMLSVSLLQDLTCCLFPYCKVSHVVCFPTARSHMDGVYYVCTGLANGQVAFYDQYLLNVSAGDCEQSPPSPPPHFILFSTFPPPTHAHTRTHARTHACTHAHTPTRTHTHTHAHAQTHTHTHTRRYLEPTPVF